MRIILGAMLLASLSSEVTAQDVSAEMTDAEWQAWVPEVSEVDMPVLAFTEDQTDRDNYEKYYFFHRRDTDFATALNDVRECDSLARGLFRGDHSVDMAGAVGQYGVGGVVGGVLGSLLADATYGSAKARTNRRVNMRRCMSYKGYSRYGLDKALWEAFNFEEGLGSVPEGDRQRMLAQQARVASQASPQTEELGL